VRAAAVELDRNSLPVPDAVDFPHLPGKLELHVGLGQRKAAVRAELDEAVLHLAACRTTREDPRADETSERPPSALAGVPLQNTPQRSGVDETLELCLLHQAPQPLILDDTGEVEERARHARHRDAPDDCQVLSA
jgi:hypothetical protein